jgi:TolB protein
MKRLFCVISLVFLLCFVFGCRQGEDVAKLTLEQTKIAFSSYRDGNHEIYVMNPDGSGQINLTNNPATDEYPSWSPDGKRIAFGSNRDSHSDVYVNAEVYIMNADGSNQTNLTNNPSLDIAPSWSPDGKKIAFYSLRKDLPDEKEYGKDERAWHEYNAEIYVMNPDGSEQTDLTNNPAYDGYPSWSPFLKTGKGQLGMELKPKEVK